MERPERVREGSKEVEKERFLLGGEDELTSMKRIAQEGELSCLVFCELDVEGLVGNKLGGSCADKNEMK